MLLTSTQSVRRRSRRRFHHDVLPVALPTPQIRIYLDDARGVRFDISDLVDLDQLSNIEESVEEDLVEFLHGDIELPIRNPEGHVERYLLRDPLAAGVTCRILRQKMRRGRRVWETVFGGVLDQPWSVEIDRREKVLSAHVFSFHKLLERASAETVGRQLSGVTGTVTASSDTVTLSSAADVLVGDILVLTDADAQEEREVQSILGSDVTTTEVWDNSFTDAEATLKKAYYRNKSIAFLAGELFTAAGVEAQDIRLKDLDLGHFPSPADWEGYINDGIYDETTSLTIRDGDLRSAVFTDQPHTVPKWFKTPDPRTEWVSLAGPILHHGDWTPYLDSEPATILDWTSATRAEDERDIGCTRALGASQNGKFRPAWNHTGGIVYEVDISSTNSRLWANGVQSGLNPIETSIANSAIFIEYEPFQDEVWYSRARNGGTLSTRVISGSNTEISTTRAGKLRVLAKLGLMAMHEYSDNETPTATISIWDPATQAVVKELTVPSIMVHMWTMRTDGERVLVIYQTSGGYRLLIWEYPSWEVLGDYSLGGDVSKAPYMTRLDQPDGTAHFVGLAGTAQSLFVVAPWYAGVVPLADFDGQSCAAAMKDLATLALCQFSVSPEKVGQLRNRIFKDPEDAGGEIPVDRPLTIAERPVWEGYRTRVEVTYRDTAGVEGTVVGGESGESARTMEVDSQLVQSKGHAEWLAERLAGFFSKVRGEQDLDTFETNTLHVADRVRISEKRFLVIKASLDLKGRRQPLTVLEAS